MDYKTKMFKKMYKNNKTALQYIKILEDKYGERSQYMLGGGHSAPNYSIIGFTPTNLTDSSSSTPVIMTTTASTTINSAYFTNVLTGTVYILNGTFPQTGTSFNLGNVTTGSLPIGIYTLSTVDNLGNLLNAPNNLTVTFTITSYTPNYVTTTLLMSSSVYTLSTSILTLGNITSINWIGPSNITNVPIISLSGNTLTLQPQTFPLDGIYTLNIITNNYGTCTGANTVSVTITNITSSTTLSSSAFTSVVTLSLPIPIISGKIIGFYATTPQTYTLPGTFPQTSTTINFNSLTGGAITDKYSVNLVTTTGDTLKSISTFLGISFQVVSISPSSGTVNTSVGPFTLTLNDGSETVSNPTLVATTFGNPNVNLSQTGATGSTITYAATVFGFSDTYIFS